MTRDTHYPFSHQSYALLTDLYQLTMAYGYWKAGIHKTEAVFHMNFRKNPFNGGFTLVAGLESLIDYLLNFRFEASDLDYLSTLVGHDNTRLFPQDFLHFLSSLRFSCDLDAIPEGTPVFPYEPLLSVQGPLLECQLLESVILNLINFPTLIATKAARMRIAAQQDTLFEFGMRRAQGIDGALTASRAAFIGGCDATSNVLAGKMFGIPVRGTHSHSWVMVFDDELEAFKVYAEQMPNNCVFLVDTFDTLKGVNHAIEIGKRLRADGKKLLGIRLDSGDLAYLSIKSRQLLDQAGFTDAKIVASNELDEVIISELKRQEACISVWGVGTNLVTSKEQPALDGVYKLSAIRDHDGQWKYKLKLSEQMIKISNPGLLRVRRYCSGEEYIADVIYDQQLEFSPDQLFIHPLDPTHQKNVDPQWTFRDLLVPIFRKGNLVYTPPSLQEVRTYAQQELAKFPKGIKRFINPYQYIVGMEKGLNDIKTSLIRNIRFGHELPYIKPQSLSSRHPLN